MSSSIVQYGPAVAQRLFRSYLTINDLADRPEFYHLLITAHYQLIRYAMLRRVEVTTSGHFPPV